AQIARVGGSSAAVAQTITTTESFHPTIAYGDGLPTIHVGFSNLTPPLLATTSKPFSCERSITMASNGTWDYGTPEDAGGAGYYMAGRTDPKGNVYFRVSYQRELLQVFGVGATPLDLTRG